MNDNALGNGGLWLFAILALMWGGNGFFGNRGKSATVEDVNATANFTRLENQVRANENYVQQSANSLGNGLSSLGYETAQQFGNTNSAMATGFCNISKEILESRYLNAQAIADSQAKTTAEIQSVKDMMYQNKIESLQAQVNQLQMAQAMNGVVRYPNQLTYCAGASPFCNGCNGNI